jgi:hypothetical protein
MYLLTYLIVLQTVNLIEIKNQQTLSKLHVSFYERLKGEDLIKYLINVSST